MLKILGVCFVLAASIAMMIFSGYTLQTLWGWFVVPVFEINPLTIPQALGISLFHSYFLLGIAVKIERVKDLVKGDDKTSFAEYLSNTIGGLLLWFITYCFVLGTGWIVTKFL